MTFSTMLIIAVVVGVLIGIGNLMLISDRKSKIAGGISALENFTPTCQITGCDGMSGLAVDESRHKVCLIRSVGSTVTNSIVDYKDLLSVELFEDGFSMTKTSRSSQLGGALLGGLALGGVGVLVGGLSGKTTTKGKIKTVQLRLVVNNTQSPLHDVTFMNIEGNKGGFVHNAAIQQARHWHGIIEVLINRADADERMNVSTAQLAIALPTLSVADELKKLAELKDLGVLTSEEFQQHKAKLLGDSFPASISS
jgi:hypothetical protein